MGLLHGNARPTSGNRETPASLSPLLGCWACEVERHAKGHREVSAWEGGTKTHRFENNAVSTFSSNPTLPLLPNGMSACAMTSKNRPSCHGQWLCRANTLAEVNGTSSPEPRNKRKWLCVMLASLDSTAAAVSLMPERTDNRRDGFS